MAPSNSPNILGQVIANCLIEKKLGEGGMGAVFLATHQGLGTKVAVKVLSAVPPPPQQFVQRFFREARALAQLEHKGIVHVFDVGQQDTFYYIVMQFVEGESLEQVVRGRGRLSISQALRIIRDIADAMAYAHDRGILHRDLKPDNVLLTNDGSVKVIDFGLAKFEGGGESQALTVTGQIMGTPMYMAPEQAEGKKADHRTDIYSLGAMGFFILTAEFPFVGKSGMDILLKKIREKPRNILELRPEIPQPVAKLVNKMMARDPEKRFQVMSDVRDILNKALSPQGSQAANDAMADQAIAEIRGSTPAGNVPPMFANTGPGSGNYAASPSSGARPAMPSSHPNRPPSRPGSAAVSASPQRPPARPAAPGSRPGNAPISGVRNAVPSPGSIPAPPRPGANARPIPPAPNRRSATPPAKPKTSTGKVVAIIVILLVLAAGVAVGGWYLLNQQKQANDPRATPTDPRSTGPTSPNDPRLIDATDPNPDNSQ